MASRAHAHPSNVMQYKKGRKKEKEKKENLPLFH